MRVPYESFGLEAWRLIWKPKYVDFSRGISETVSYCRRKFRVHDYSDPAKQNARLGRVDIIELRKCLLLSMLATFPSSPSHGHRFRRRRRRGHDDRWLTAICFDRVNDSWPQRHDITTRSWGPTSYDWFCQLNSRRTSKNWIAQIILRLQSSD